MLSIGITGGIGSGKTHISNIFRALGYPVFDCDREAKALYDSDAELKSELIALFGKELYDTKDGRLDRKRLGAIIFSSDKALKEVNALVHPAVRRAFKLWQDGQRERGYKLCFLESAILFNSNLSSLLDKTLLVCADESTRLQRAMSRDGVSAELIRQRMAKQLSQDEMTNLTDSLINNNDSQPLLVQINYFLEENL